MPQDVPAGQAVTPPAAARCIFVGGTSGIGFAAAGVMIARGAQVAIIGRDAARAKAAAATLGAGVVGDGADQGGLEAAIVRSIEALGGLSGIVCTAGKMIVQDDILALSDEDWAESFDTQLMSVVRAARAAIPALIANGGGAFITTSAYSIHAPKTRLAHYTSIKAAIPVITKTLAKAYGAQGIRANCIAPGAIATRPAQGLDLAARWQVMRDQFGMNCGLDRIGEPHEVAELIAFLLSDEAAYLTGALINIDGGTDF